MPGHSYYNVIRGGGSKILSVRHQINIHNNLVTTPILVHMIAWANVVPPFLHSGEGRTVKTGLIC